jgi:uncharacterized membrane protein (UPF0127 family)
MGRSAGALIVAAFCVLAPFMAQGACAPDRLSVQTSTSRPEFSVEVADTDAERAQGLMNRPHMASAAGMLFVYDSAQRAQFWMANTLIPLDIIFAADDGTILKVHANAVPLDRTVIDGGDGVRYVLEINGGLAGRMGIAAGGALHHPAIAGSDCAAP